MVAPDEKTRFERHPVLTLALVVFAALALFALAAELVLRATLDYYIDYYAGTTREGWVEYPYGRIFINSRGHPDVEWDLNDPRPRVGFYGDSVTYGVGAGHGHRVSDLVAAAHPELQVMTLAAVGARLKRPEALRRLARELDLDVVIYLMNLNDVTPDPLPDVPLEPGRKRDRASAPSGARASEADSAPAPRESVVRRLRAALLGSVDGLRNKSYLYNFVRLRVKNLVVLAGYESSGFRAVELEPSRHPEVFDVTAARVNDAARRLVADGRELCVVLLPYEMQVSAEAAERYAELGVRWEDGFLDGSAQREIRSRLDPMIPVLDARSALLADGTRPEAALGELFVYDRGDKIDWNHPTREGHRRIARRLNELGFCLPCPQE